MRNKGKWAIFLACSIIMSLIVVSMPVVACFSHYTECEGQQVYQGDGGATDYWYDELFPPTHDVDPGASTDWLIHIWGSKVCSQYEHATISNRFSPPSGWTYQITMHTITTGSFHYIAGGNVNIGDDIEDREFYIGGNWDFTVRYRLTAPAAAPGGETANMVCRVYVVGYQVENQHDTVDVHCNARVSATAPPTVTVTYPNGGETLTGTEDITWDATDPGANPLTFKILLSSDSGLTYPTTLISGLGDVRLWSWDTTAFPDDLYYRVRVIAHNGVSYGCDESDGDFAIDNVGPDPPTHLQIQFGLTSYSEPSAKAVDDNTGSPLERVQKDDGRAYTVQKGNIMSLDTFDTHTQNDPVGSAVLQIEYHIENEDYSGTNSVLWKMESDIFFTSTGIMPTSADMMPTIGTYDLYAQGVDTIDKIANLDIYFQNDDAASGQNVYFDYIWVVFTASAHDIGMTWSPCTAPDMDHYHIYRSPDDITYTLVGESSTPGWNDAVGTATDSNNYFYKVYGVDLSAREGTPSGIVGKFANPVTAGWNLVSNPMVSQTDNTMDTILHSIEGDYQGVQTYNAGLSRPWLHWNSVKPGCMNDIAEIGDSGAYYLDMDSSDNLCTLGEKPSGASIPLKTGWNLVGYPSLASELRDTALSSISGQYDVVYTFDPATGREIEVTPSDTMDPGNGYWIHVKSDCTLSM